MRNRHSTAIAWMRGSFGISVHWTTHSVRADGSRLPYREAVAAFNPERFAGTLAEAGAKHCIFTLTHAEQYLALPHPVLEKLLPGRTTERDLIGELIDALAARDIRFIAYYNHACNGNNDPAWRKACGYDAGIRGDLDTFARNICAIVAFMAKRYGKSLSGWWFDSSYSVDPRGPHNSVSCEMGEWQFPWAALARAATGGNPECAVAFNAGVGSRFLYAGCQNYYAGEAVALTERFSPGIRPGMRDTRWICLDSPDWLFSQRHATAGFSAPRFSDREVADYLDRHLRHGRMVTFNLQIDQEGRINPAALDQLRRLRESSGLKSS